MNLVSAKEDLQSRIDETEQLLKFVQYLEDSYAKPESESFELLKVKTSIKANIVLMLYNAVESTVTNALTEIHKYLTSETVKYSSLIPEIRKLLGVYYGYTIEKANDMHKRIDAVLGFLDIFSEINSFNIPYKEFSKNYQLYSGNLDSKEIRSVLDKYGIAFSKKCSELQTIKNARNKLAHGEQSFEEAGRDLTIQQLTVMKNKTYEFLTIMIDAVENYLNNNSFSLSGQEPH